MNIEIKITAASVEELQAALAELGKKPATHVTVIPDDPRIKGGELTIPAGTDLTIAKVSRNDVQLTAAPDPQPMQMPEPAPEKPKRKRVSKQAAEMLAESAQEAAGEPEAPQAATTPAELETAAEPQQSAPDAPELGGPQFAEPQPAEPVPTKEQIGAAGAKMLDENPNAMPQLLSLLGEYGVQAVMQLKDDQLAGFAAKLRALGAEV